MNTGQLIDNNTIRLAIADDQYLVRQGITTIIRSDPSFEIVLEAANGMELIYGLQNCNPFPDICALDICMPGLNGYETLKQIRQHWPHLKVLVLAECFHEFSMFEMIRNGANGYLEKKENPRRLLHALASVYFNGSYFPEASSKVICDIQRGGNPFIPKITEREMEFLTHTCSELHYREIAQLMGVSSRTVEAFRDSLFAKFNITSRVGLAIFAIRNGIVSLDKEPVQYA